jgi:hypothetical protein
MPNGTMGTGRGASRKREVETIERAAILYNGTIYSVPRPGRHHTVIRMMARDNFPNEAMALKNQGFVTSTGRFVDRYEGAKIARAAGQIIREPTPPDMLTSEDVW